MTLALLGDVMLGRSVRPSADTFAYLEPALATADLALANLESPLTGAPVVTTSPYALCAPPANVRYLAVAGIDLLSLANNHRLDCGEKGLADTETTLSGAGLGYLGPDGQAVYRQVHGLKLAFLAFDATGQLGVFDLAKAVEAVRLARQSGAVVVVSMHWGLEYQSGSTAEQRAMAGEIANAGAALIWGQHPHVVQPAQWLSHPRTLVLFSLGNALFDQAGLATTEQSALVIVTLDAAGVEQMRAIPFVIDVPHSRLVAPEPSAAQAILENFRATPPSP